jgi:hypothetical protein
MTRGNKSVQAVNTECAVSSQGKNTLDFKNDGISVNKRRLSHCHPRRVGLRTALPIIAEVDFEDSDESDVSTARFHHLSDNALPEGWPDALVNPWNLLNDEASCKLILRMLKDGKYDQSALLAWLCPALLSLACSDHGSQVVYAVLEIATGDARNMIASQFHGCVRDLCMSPTGHLVLSEFIGTMPISAIGFVAIELEGKALEVARHKFGYRVLEAMIMHGSHLQISKLSAELVKATVVLAKDPYGQHVLRHLLEHGSEGCRREVVQRLAFAMVSVSQQPPLTHVKPHVNHPHFLCQHQQSRAIGYAGA